MDSQAPSPDLPVKTGLVARWSTLLFLAGMVCTTSAPIFMRLSEIGPIATGAWRMTLALPLLALLLHWERKREAQRPPLSRADFWLIVLGGLFFAGDLAFWNTSVMLTSVASASFLANSTPLLVVLGAWLLLKERPSGLFLAGLAIGVIGSAVMMSESFAMSPGNFAGDILAIVSAAFYAGYLLAVARARKNASTMMLMAISSIACVAALWAAALCLETQLAPTTANGWLVLIGNALLTHVAGQTLIALSLGYVSANFSALILLVGPVIPTLAAWLLFGEMLSAMQILGAAGIVAGLALARPRQVPV